MAFCGSQQKCKACNKTVHFIEMVSADGVPYHKTCFKCSHCNNKLAMSTFSSIDGALYCKPHFEQLFKEKGGLAKNFQPSGKQAELTKTPSKLSSMFSGTQDKCAVCKKTVYPLEKVTVEGEFYHKPCFRCSHGGCKITPSSYAALDGILYCKPHFSQLFKEKGCYNHLTKTASMKKNGPTPKVEMENNQETISEEPEQQQE